MLLVVGRTFLLFHWRPNLPDSNCLVSGYTDHSGVIVGCGEEKDPAGVTRQVRHLHQRLLHVLAEPMPVDQLLGLRVPDDAGHLGPDPVSQLNSSAMLLVFHSLTVPPAMARTFVCYGFQNMAFTADLC